MSRLKTSPATITGEKSKPRLPPAPAHSGRHTLIHRSQHERAVVLDSGISHFKLCRTSATDARAVRRFAFPRANDIFESCEEEKADCILLDVSTGDTLALLMKTGFDPSPRRLFRAARLYFQPPFS
jgi:hypothetical protein